MIAFVLFLDILLQWWYLLELLSMTQTAEIIAEASLLRHESRGVFSRSDYPETDPHLDHHNTLISREGTHMRSRMEELS